MHAGVKILLIGRIGTAMDVFYIMEKMPSVSEIN
jgi:hypothetical protein